MTEVGRLFPQTPALGSSIYLLFILMRELRWIHKALCCGIFGIVGVPRVLQSWFALLGCALALLVRPRAIGPSGHRHSYHYRGHDRNYRNQRDNALHALPPFTFLGNPLWVAPFTSRTM